MINILYNYQFNYKQLLETLITFDSFFSPSFSSEVNLKQYAHKLIEHASFVIAKETDQIIGLIAYYKNTEKQELYIPYICITPHMQGRNIGSKMLNVLSENESQYNSITLEVYKANIKGINFYTKNRFKIVKEQQNEKYLMTKRLGN